MEQKSDEESSEKQPADSPSKRGSKVQKSGDGAHEKQSDGSSSKSESNGETEKNEQDTETLTTPSDKRKLEGKEATVGASKMSIALSPTKRKCTEIHVVASEIIKPGERQLQADEPKPGPPEAGATLQGSPKRSPTIPGTSAASGVMMQGSPKRSPTVPGTSAAAGVIMQRSPERSPTIPSPSEAGITLLGSPKRSPTIPGTSAAAGVLMQGSPKRSPTLPGTSAATSDVIMQGSPKRSPTKRTYKERQQSCNVDELVEKRLREEIGYQSDSALDLRKDQSDSALDLRKEFKKQMPSSTQSPELDCQPTSSDKMEEDSEKRPDSKYATQSNSPPGPRSAASEVTSSDGSEADVSSTSNESVTSTTGGVVSSAQGNVAEANKKKTSPRTSPRRSGARPKEAASGSRSVEYIQVSFPKHSPSKRFYGEPTIRRISPQRVFPPGGGFKVPPPPPPLEERYVPVKITNALENLHCLIVDVHAIVTAEQLRDQMRKEQEEKARKERESAEKFARAQAQAKETTRKLREKEARAKEGDNKLSIAGNKTDIAPDEAVAGPSGLCPAVPARGGKVEVEAPLGIRTPPSAKEVHKSTEPKTENLPAAAGSALDENTNVMVKGLSRSPRRDDNANKSESCTVQTSREGTESDAKESASSVAAERPQETPSSPEHLSLQQLVPQINEISLDDSLENVAIVDSDQEDDSDDLQNV